MVTQQHASTLELFRLDIWFECRNFCADKYTVGSWLFCKIAILNGFILFFLVAIIRVTIIV